jgi:hypothetical protein
LLVIFEILIYFSKRCHKFANLVIIINKVDSYTHARAPRASFQNFSKLWDYIGDKYHALLGCLCCKFSMGHVTWSDHGFSSARGKTLGTSLIFSAFYHFLRSHISVSPQVRIRVLSKSFSTARRVHYARKSRNTYHAPGRVGSLKMAIRIVSYFFLNFDNFWLSWARNKNLYWQLRLET